eukprot:GHVS01067807.1.p1 GENE.GHVS01067807.1~~GHVS01067807.1.p1  ORF type:complete len:137 (+),score=27.72 GHVS01067807.1:320-730(+)
MDASQPLRSADSKLFDVVVFGGILGNVPSDDRTAEVRKHRFDHRRHLGPLQMTTNTAVAVTKLVLEEGVELEDICFVDEPDIPTGPKEETSLPFRYICEVYWRDRKDNHQQAVCRKPLLPDGMVEYLTESAEDDLT